MAKTAKPETRIETDTLGQVQVAFDRYWGAQTQRSLENFAIGDERFPRAFLWALATIKKLAAVANQELGELDARIGGAIARAAQEVADGLWDEHFPLSIWQTGSGTQTNMNANEVIANRANELLGAPLGAKAPVHPNDHVNHSQSSNDVFPSAMHLAAVQQLQTHLLPRVIALRDELFGKAKQFHDVIKIGRTHLQDATPIRLGQEFSGYVAQLDLDIVALRQAETGMLPLALGGTAVGTGMGAPAGFSQRVCALLAELTGWRFTSADNKFAALAGHEAMSLMSGALRTLATSLMKAANDVRWLASGPRAGLGELSLPANEPGSSIMPGKVNPTQAEALTMVCVQVIANDVAVGMACAQGNFELNVFKPVIVHNVLRSMRLLGDAAKSFQVHCVSGIEANRGRIQENLERSLMLVTALVPKIGYDRAAEIAKRAHETGRTLREVALELGYVSSQEFDRLVDPSKMVGPG